GGRRRRARGRGRRLPARRGRRRLRRLAKRGRVVVGLAADLASALLADVVVLVSGRQHEKELLADRDRPATAWAEEARGFELAVGVAHDRPSCLGFGTGWRWPAALRVYTTRTSCEPLTGGANDDRPLHE